MIGHFLLQLTPAQASAVLVTAIEGGRLRKQASTNGSLCLTEAARGFTGTSYEFGRDVRYGHELTTLIAWEGDDNSVPWRYDYLCIRFGEVRVNAAIRNRILSNRAWRVLSTQDRYTVGHGHQGPRAPSEAPEPKAGVSPESSAVRSSASA